MRNLLSLPMRFILWFKPTSLRNKIFVVIIVLVLLFFGWKTIFAQKAAPQYQTAQVTKRDIISSASESGNISPGSEVEITSPTNGIITNLYVKNGDEVSAGENLFEVKATATPQDQASAYAAYESALSSQQSAQQSKQALVATLEKDRQAVLDAQNNVNYMQNNTINPSTKQGYTDLEKQSLQSVLTSAQESFSADETKYNQEDTTIAAADAQLNSASLAYQATQDSVVTAPVAGTVANLTAGLGGDVSASSGNSSTNTSGTSSGSNSSSSSSTSSSTTSSSPVMVIGDFSQLYVKVAASEVDVPNIKPGQKATITLDAFTGKTFVGTVTDVDTVGTVSSGVVTYNVYISFDYAPPGVMPGMTATASIQTARHSNVLTVPTSAIQTINGASYVRVLSNGKINEVPVTTGIASDTDTEVTSGLSEGQTVVTGSISTTATGSSSSSSSPFSGTRGFGGGAIFRSGGGGGRPGGGG